VSEGGSNGGWGSVRDDLAADVRRVADRLRSLSQSRLAAPVPPHASRADAARTAAQVLADAAQGLAERASSTEPSWRDLPVLSDFAVGDQVAVTGRDLLDEIDATGPTDDVWARGCRRTAREAVAHAAATLAETRRLL
jgi:hypothetical protein